MKRPTKILALPVTVKDLDNLKEIFGEMAANPGEGRGTARKMIRAVRSTALKFGFRYYHE